jgi:hypothetical protein
MILLLVTFAKCNYEEHVKEDGLAKEYSTSGRLEEEEKKEEEGKEGSVYIILVGRPARKRTLEKPRRE